MCELVQVQTEPVSPVTDHYQQGWDFRSDCCGGPVAHQNPSVVEVGELLLELEDQHQEDSAGDDAAVLDQQ